VRVRFIGDRESLPVRINESISDSESKTDACDGLRLFIAFNYGGRAELTRAARGLALAVEAGEIKPDDIDQETFERYLYAPDFPNLDLLIRTGGEYRISNFLLWQSAYAEIYFTDLLWPDFDESAFDEALDFYSSRDRRFGGLK
jgi:undecaprenyl diphosphate synthase